jgi:hypothetical protein
MGSNLPVPNSHVEVLYRQTYNTLGGIIAADLTQDNVNGPTTNVQAQANTRTDNNTNKGILAGSVVATAGEGTIGPAITDGTNFDKVVGIAVNDAVGNPYESSSAVASQKIVYMHGTGTVFKTDIYETYQANGTTALVYAYGDLLYASQNGLLTKREGLLPAGSGPLVVPVKMTCVGIVLTAPSADNSYYMTVQMRI